MSMNTLREARKAAGLSQEQVAAKAGLTDGMVSLLENGYRPRRGTAVGAVARALGISEHRLYDIETKKPA